MLLTVPVGKEGKELPLNTVVLFVGASQYPSCVAHNLLDMLTATLTSEHCESLTGCSAVRSSYFLGEMHGNVNSIVCGIILLLIYSPKVRDLKRIINSLSHAYFLVRIAGKWTLTPSASCANILESHAM